MSTAVAELARRRNALPRPLDPRDSGIKRFLTSGWTWVGVLATVVYFCALLIENEIRDQFGICFSDIVLDFGGALYLEEEVRAMPFCKVSVAQKQS